MEILLVNYDNGSRWPVLPQNLYQLARCLELTGHHHCEVLDFNLTKDPYSKLHWLSPDIIGLGFISGYWPHRQAQLVAKAIEDHPKRRHLKWIIGGHGPSAAPEYYRRKLKADAVFTGSADISLPAWISAGMPEGVIPSQGYNTDITQVVETDMDVYKRIMFPNTRPDEFAIQVLTGRGCPYKCAFCFRMGEKYERYKIHHLIEDIKWYYYVDGITHFQFSDELLMGSLPMCEDLVSALAQLQSQTGARMHFDCNGRVKFAADHPRMLATMKAAGFRYINYGCESMSQDVLASIRKQQSVDDIKKGVENTLAAGLTPGLNFMWGNPHDDEKTLWAAAEFINEYSDGTELRTIRPVTPYPGTELFDRLIIEDRCGSVDEFYEQHTNSDLFSYHFMKGITNQEANILLGEANAYLFEDYVSMKETAQANSIKAFYSGESDPLSFRGFREI